MNQTLEKCPGSNIREAEDAFRQFRDEIRAALSRGTLADSVIGKDHIFEGPFGPKKLIYADYAASGRALCQVEQFIMDRVLPVYANPHTQASYCGGMMNGLRRIARQEITQYCGAGDGDAVIFAGSGATAGIHKLVRLFGVDQTGPADMKPLVLLGPYEHHSNLLPWRESGAEVVELPEGNEGGVDFCELERVLVGASGRHIVCSFSAGSNVTGALTDIVEISRLVKRHGGLIIWDFAGAAPYIPMTMVPAVDVQIDALVFSPHKFIGGPAASGILVVHRDSVILDKPSAPGGGTVSFVSPDMHDYLDTLEAREEAGTPNVIGDIRAALAIIVRDCLAEAGLDQRADAMCKIALASWRANPQLEILGADREAQLPIVSFRVRGKNGALVNHQLVTRILSDKFGIQARGGCACAGPYVHQLLNIDTHESEAIRQSIKAGEELEKPGFARVNFSPLLSDQDFSQLVISVNQVAKNIESYASQYSCNPATAVFHAIARAAK
ncbi:aminotransferase class V-fold PLP-dependent enzyme [Parasphingorhabdus sp.]|uniref:aminotransferase class V-fold PLP-dependent enzyme n=1 Tax=Parasphingorhabdus sp. TaxID=2709688 RepID=UPI0032EE0F4A